MEQVGRTRSGDTIGSDLGDRFSYVCVLDAAGDVVRRERVRTVRARIEELFAEFPSSPVVMDVGSHSPWVSRVVGMLGHEVIVANPGKDWQVTTRCSLHLRTAQLGEWG